MVDTTSPMTRASCMGNSVRDFDGVDDADDGRVDGAVLQAGGHACRAAAHDEDGLADAGVDGVDGDEVAAFSLAARVHRARDEQLVAHEPLVLARRHDGTHDLGEDHFAAAVAFPMGSASSRLACGRGITWTETSSPTRRAAAAPASVAALTAATSPRTIAVTYPAPIFSHPTRVTLAAFTIASAASIMATRPFVSTMPSASPMQCLPGA